VAPEPEPERAAPGSGEGLDASRLRELGIDPFAPDPGPAAGSGTAGDDHAEGRNPADLDADAPMADVAPADVPMADTPMWLSHHWPEDYDRCAVVGGLHICRRCLVLYPLALVAGIAVSVGSWWDHAWDPWVLWLAPLPGVVEFVLDNLRLITYRPWRQVVLSAGGAVAAGIGYVRYLDDTTDTLAWSVLAVYTAVTLSAAVVGGLLRQRRRTARARESQ
jgi:hypothetical protein